MRRLSLAALILAHACGDTSTPGFSTGPGATSISQTSGSSGGSISTAGASSTSTSSGADVSTAASSASGVGTLDMGLPPDFGPPQPEGCKGKIDFLFVISRGSTMKQEQGQLLASLPGFMATIDDSFADYEPHILVANPDGEWTPEGCDKYLCPMYAPTCGPGAEEYVCYVNEINWPCDQEIGAGLLFNAGPDATNHPCVLQNGRRYITPDEPNPLEAFMCMAQVGTFGPDTPMRDALYAAVQPTINGPRGCNEGFLRPDALLVVMMIFNSQDVKSWQKPQEVYEAVIAAKGGDQDAVVTVVITFPTTNEAQKPDCSFGDYPDPLKDLALLFPYNVVGDACADSYATYLELAAAKVADACSKFIPQ